MRDDRTEYFSDEFFDLHKILEVGARKHGAFNYLEKDGSTTDFKDMHNSMIRHLAESMQGIRIDEESNADPLLNLAARALMCYTRLERGLEDKDSCMGGKVIRDNTNKRLQIIGEIKEV